VFERQRDSAIACYANESEFSCPQNFLVLFSYKKNSPADIKQDNASYIFLRNSGMTASYLSSSPKSPENQSSCSDLVPSLEPLLYDSHQILVQ